MTVLTSRNIRNVLDRGENLIPDVPVNESVRFVYAALNGTSAYSIPAGATRVRVVTGSAWISYHGADHVLVQADEMPLDPRDAHTAVATGLNNRRVILSVTLGADD